MEDKELLMEDGKPDAVEKNTRQFMEFMTGLKFLESVQPEELVNNSQTVQEEIQIQEKFEDKEHSRFCTLVIKNIAVLLVYIVCWILTPVYLSHDIFMVILSLLSVAAILTTLMNRLQISEFLLTIATVHSTLVFFLTLLYGDSWILSLFGDSKTFETCSTLPARALCCSILEVLLLLDTRDEIKAQKSHQASCEVRCA